MADSEVFALVFSPACLADQEEAYDGGLCNAENAF